MLKILIICSNIHWMTWLSTQITTSYSKVSFFQVNEGIRVHSTSVAHLQCAGYEMPLSDTDEKWFGPSMKEICQRRLEKDTDGW